MDQKDKSQARKYEILRILADGAAVKLDDMMRRLERAYLALPKDRGAVTTQLSRLKSEKMITSPYEGAYQITEAGREHRSRFIVAYSYLEVPPDLR